MDEVFIIMQIGNTQLDAACDEAIDPAIRNAGFVPRRVDRHNSGDLLKREIVQFIERSRGTRIRIDPRLARAGRQAPPIYRLSV